MTRIDELFYDIDLNTKDAERKAKALNKELDLYERFANEGAQATRRYGQEQETAGRRVRRNTEAHRRQERILGRVQRRIAVLIGTYLGFNSVIRLLRNVTEDTVKFDRAMGQVGTLMRTTTGPAFELVEDRVESLTLALPKTADDLGFGLYQTLSSGITDSADAMLVLDESAKLASSGLLDTQSSVDAVTTVMNAYGIAARDASTVTDVFFTTVEQGKTTVPQLANSIGTVATSAALAGVSIEDLGASIAVMTKLGIDAQTTTTSLNRFFLSLVDSQESTRDAAEELGIEWSLAALQAKGLSQFLADLEQATHGNIEALATLGLDLRAARSLFILAGSGADQLAAAQNAMADAQGATDRAVQRTNQTFEAQFQIIRNRLSVAFRDLGGNVLPPLLSVFERLAQFLESDFDRRIRNLRAIGADEGLIADLIRQEEVERARSALEDLQNDLDELRRPGAVVDRSAASFQGQFNRARIEIEELTREMAEVRRETGLTTEEADRLVQRLQEGADVVRPGATRLASLQQQLRLRQEEAEEAARGLRLLDEKAQLEERIARLQDESVASQAAQTEQAERTRTAIEAQVEAVEVGLATILREIAALDDVSIDLRGLLAPAGTPESSFPQAERFLEQMALRVQLLARMQDQFTGSTAQIVDLETQIQDMMGSTNDEITRRGALLLDALGSFQEVRDAVEKLRVADEKLADAMATENPRKIEAAQKAVRSAVEGVAEAMRDAEDATDDAVGSMDDLERKARDIAALTRGILDFADAFGVLDDNLRRTLDGATGVAEAVVAITSGGLNPANLLGVLGGGVQFLRGLGGFLGIGGRSSAPQESAAEREQRERIAENTDALRRLGDTITDLADSLLDLPLSGVTSAFALAVTRAEAINRGVREAIAQLDLDDEEGLARLEDELTTPLEQLEGSLRRFGLTMSDVEQVAESLGIEWDGTARTMRVLEQALQNIEFTSIFETFAGQMQLLRREFELFDVDDPVEQMQRLLAVADQFTNLDVPDFDLSTPEGRASLEEFIRGVFEQVRTGSPEDIAAAFGGLTVNEVLDLLGDIERIGDRLADEAADKADAPTFTRNVQITEASASRLLALSTTAVSLSERIADLAVRRNQILESMAASGMPALQTQPNLASTSVRIDNVNVQLQGSTPTDESTARRMGGIIADEVVEVLDRKLGQSRERSQRTTGAAEVE